MKGEVGLVENCWRGRVVQELPGNTKRDFEFAMRALRRLNRKLFSRDNS